MQPVFERRLRVIDRGNRNLPDGFRERPFNDPSAAERYSGPIQRGDYFSNRNEAV